MSDLREAARAVVQSAATDLIPGARTYYEVPCELIDQLSAALDAETEEGWRDIASAPVGKNVLAYGGGGHRVMRKDDMGQWRNMLGAPKPAPAAWRPLRLADAYDGVGSQRHGGPHEP
jgi:hypothetical protein